MRRSTRRLTFQLTPLLDLLLIVVFAQFLDVRDRAESIEENFAAQLEQSEQQRHLLSSQLSQSRRELLAMRRLEGDEQTTALELAELQRQNAGLSMKLVDLQAELDLAREQRDTLGRLAGEMFDVPEETLSRLLQGDRPEDILSEAQVRQQLDQLRDRSASAIVLHLLTYAELQKRSDIWKLYVTESGLIRLLTPAGLREFRSTTPETFSEELFAAYKSLPQPKSLVIILVSYGDAQAGVRYAVTRGLPVATSRMRDDSGGRSRFEYAILGYRPDENEFVDDLSP